MKLSSFILMLCCILSLVFANDTRKCNCENTVLNCDQLPRCGKAILRNRTSCEIYKNENKTKIAECNKIHFSENLNNNLNCSIGTKAWPLMFIWNVTYENFTLDDNSTRPVYKINDEFPTPTIHAIKGDWVLIPVINNIKKPANSEGKCGELTTIHWHGITMRIVERWNHTIVPGTPFMDGVPGINQCPIPGCDNQGNRFDYFFQFVDSGTFWYHSHYEMQIADGLAGPIIVKDCDDRVKFLNDYGSTYCETDDWDNTTIAVRDWFNVTTAEDEFKNYTYTTTNSSIVTDNETAYMVPNEPKPKTVIINGGTKFILNVTRGNTYRLRLINMSAMALFTFSIENHTFEIIEVEGMLVKRNNNTAPFKELTINSGQRYSILLNANQTGSFYGMYFYTKGCHRINGFPQSITGTIRYDNVDDVAKPLTFGKTKCTDLPKNALIPYCDNNYTSFCGKPPARNGNTYKMDIIIDTLTYEISKIDDNDKWKQNVVGYLSHDFKPYYDHKWNNIKNNTFLEVLKLNKTTAPKSWDPTLNVYSLNEPKVHDIIFNNIDLLEHPIHLHGHFFYVLGFGSHLTGDDSDYSLNEINPIQRDTITVPSRGWAQIRFVVDNPGVWPMHCHIDWHLGVGMLAQFVELGRSDVAKIYTEDNNKPPKEWCEACTDAENAESYCAKKQV